MASYGIKLWDDAGSLAAESEGTGDPTGPVLEALRSNRHHTADIEIADDGDDRLLVASRTEWAFVGWADLFSGRLHHLSTDAVHQPEQVEMYVGGVNTRVNGAELVPVADVELAVREFLASSRGSLGLVWVEP